MDKGDTPDVPNYQQLAQQQQKSYQNAARDQTQANRVTQSTPFGSSTWKQNATLNNQQQARYDAALAKYNTQLANWTKKGGKGKKPIAPDVENYADPDQGWEQVTTLSPEQEALYKGNTALSQGMVDTAQSVLPKIQDLINNPGVDETKLTQSMIDPGQTYIDAAMKFMRPEQDRQYESLRQQMANQGIAAGTSPYSTEFQNLNDAQARNKLQAIMMGIDKNQTARQQQLSEQYAAQDRPINLINALRSGNQVSMPQFQGFAQQGAAPGVDYMGAANAGYQGDLNNYNAQQAGLNNAIGGLFGIGGAALGSPWLGSKLGF